MNRREEIEALAVHSNQMPGANLTQNERVQGLLDLAEQLQAILVPIEPNIDFRRRLHGNLILEAQRDLPLPGLLYQHRKGIIIGAAAVGSVASVAGVAIAVLLRHRHRFGSGTPQGRATHIATG